MNRFQIHRELQINNQGRLIDQTKFTYSPPGKSYI